MKKIVFLLAISSIFSCHQNDKKEECKNYWDNLNYLKNYSENLMDSTYFIKEVSKRIEYLEKNTGVKAINQRDWIGRHEVKKEDLKGWEEWIKKRQKIISVILIL